MNRRIKSISTRMVHIHTILIVIVSCTLILPSYANTSPTNGYGGYTSPVCGHWITRRHRKIDAVDISAPKHTPISAVETGNVIVSTYGKRGSGYGGYGNVILIKGNNGSIFLYAHTHKRQVRVGDRVQRGQQIATVGRTGARLPHLHLERRNTNNKKIKGTVTYRIARISHQNKRKFKKKNWKRIKSSKPTCP